MRLDKLTVKAQEALQAAQSMADQHDHQAIEPEHLLVALLEQREGVVGPVLAKLGARPESWRRSRAGAGTTWGSGRGRRSIGPRPRPGGSRTNTSRPSTFCWRL